MSKLFVVSVFDTALDAFSRPFFVPSTQVALRTFSDEVNRAAADNPLHGHPEDFALYCLATFDDVAGSFSNLEQRELLVRAKDVHRG